MLLMNIDKYLFLFSRCTQLLGAGSQCSFLAFSLLWSFPEMLAAPSCVCVSHQRQHNTDWRLTEGKSTLRMLSAVVTAAEQCGLASSCRRSPLATAVIAAAVATATHWLQLTHHYQVNWAEGWFLGNVYLIKSPDLKPSKARGLIYSLKNPVLTAKTT